MTCELAPGREGSGKDREKRGRGKETAYSKALEMRYLRNRKETKGAESKEHGICSLK